MKKFYLKNLDCANCAQKIVDTLKHLEGTKSVELNFPVNILYLDTTNESLVLKKIKELEPQIEIEEECGEESFSHFKITFLLLGFIVAAILNYFKIEIPSYVLLAIVYILSVKKIIYGVIGGFKTRNFFNENILMLSASIAAFCLGAYVESVAIIVFYNLGEHLQSFAVFRSKKAFNTLSTALPKNIKVQKENQVVLKPVDAIEKNEIIFVNSGDIVPLDGVIVEGEGFVDMQAITGESIPVVCKQGDKILSGSIILDTSFRICVENEYKNSFASKMQTLLETAVVQKTKTYSFITKFSHYYTPIVFAFAISVCFLTYIFGYGDLRESVYRGLVILMVSCPCALMLAIPLGYFIAIGSASKEGILIKDIQVLEKMLEINTIIFDKTGTLTYGELAIKKVESCLFSEEELLKNVGMALKHSNHLIARSFKNYFIDKNASEVREFSGQGILVKVDKKDILIGNIALMQRFGVICNENNEIGIIVYVAIDGKYAGYIVLQDLLRKEAVEVAKSLKKLKKELVVLSGDTIRNVKNTILDLGCKYYAQTLPDEKYQIIQQYKKQNKVLFIGDGMNDAPAIGIADVGVSMGIRGSDISRQNAEVLLLKDDLRGLIKLFDVSKKTRKIMWQNIVFIFVVKAVFIVCGIFGLAEIWEAIFGDVGVSLIALLNTWRIFNK